MFEPSWWHVYFAAVVFFMGGFVMAGKMHAGARADDLDEMIARKSLEDRARDWQ